MVILFGARLEFDGRSNIFGAANRGLDVCCAANRGLDVCGAANRGLDVCGHCCSLIVSNLTYLTYLTYQASD